MSKKIKLLNLGLAKIIFSLFCGLGIVCFFICSLSTPGWSKDDRIDTPAKIKQLKHRDAGMRASAADQLGRNRKKEAGVDLLTALRNEKDETVKLHLIASLSEIGEQSALPVLMKLAENDKAENVRAVSCLYLGKFNQPEVVQLLKNVLLNEEEKNSVRINAASALSFHLDKDGIKEAMEEVLKGENKIIKYGLINSLRHLGKEATGRALLKLAEKDQDREIGKLAKDLLEDK